MIIEMTRNMVVISINRIFGPETIFFLVHLTAEVWQMVIMFVSVETYKLWLCVVFSLITDHYSLVSMRVSCDWEVTSSNTRQGYWCLNWRCSRSSITKRNRRMSLYISYSNKFLLKMSKTVYLKKYHQRR